MTRPVLTIACRAGELVETLAESLRVVVHAQLDELIALQQTRGDRWTLTDEGERAVGR